MTIIIIFAAAFVGGVANALLGWIDSKLPFVPRKFVASVIRALVAGVVFAIGYSYGDGIGIMDIGVAFLGGAGVDVIGNRIAGVVKSDKTRK